MNQSVIKVVDGDEFVKDKCFYCGNDAIRKLMISTSSKHNGEMVNWVSLCDDHMEKVVYFLENPTDQFAKKQNKNTLSIGALLRNHG